jgi:hypothetical protein
MMKRHRPTQAELDAMVAYMEAVQAGRQPGIERYLKRFPAFAATLRPVLQGMAVLDREYKFFRKNNPGIDLERLYCIPGAQ